MIPDNPEEGVLYLIKSALNAINKYSWDRSQAVKSLALLDGIKLLVSACQESYPYSYQVNTYLTSHLTSLYCQGHTNNAELYGHDQTLIEELERMVSTLLDMVISTLNTAISNSSQTVVDTLTVNLLETLVVFSEIPAKV